MHSALCTQCTGKKIGSHLRSLLVGATHNLHAGDRRAPRPAKARARGGHAGFSRAARVRRRHDRAATCGSYPWLGRRERSFEDLHCARRAGFRRASSIDRIGCRAPRGAPQQARRSQEPAVGRGFAVGPVRAGARLGQPTASSAGSRGGLLAAAISSSRDLRCGDSVFHRTSP